MVKKVGIQMLLKHIKRMNKYIYIYIQCDNLFVIPGRISFVNHIFIIILAGDQLTMEEPLMGLVMPQ